MNIKKLCAVLTVLCFAEAAFAVAAVSYTFNPSDKTAGFAPTNAYTWAAVANWGGSGYPQAVGDAADLSSSELSALSNPTFLMLPDGGIDIGGIKGNSSLRFNIIGDELCIDSNGYEGNTPINPGRISGENNTYVFATLNVKSQTSGMFNLAGDWNMTTGDGKVTLSIGNIKYRADFYANSSNPEREREVALKEVSASSGTLEFYGPRGSGTDIVSTWSQVEGSPYVKWVSGTKGTLLPVGTIVTGSGIQDGTFLKRIFNNDWLELSKPVTLTAAANSLTFAAFAPRAHAFISKWTDSNSNANFGLRLNKYRDADDFRIEITTLATGSQNYDLPLRVSDGISYPATVVLHDTTGVQKRVRVENAHIELVPDIAAKFFENAAGIYFKEAASKLRVTVTNSASLASMHSISNFVGTLVKDGDGTLETGFDESYSSGTVVVEAGRLVLTNASGEASATLANLCVSNGAAFVLSSGCTLSVQGGTLATGATICAEDGANIDLSAVSIETGVTFKGPGTFVFARSSQLSAAKTLDCPKMSFVEQGTARNIAPYDDVVPEVVGHPAFWVSADKNVDIMSFESSGKAYDNGVACWRDCRDGETTYYATNDFSQLTVNTGVPSRWFENNGCPYIYHVGLNGTAEDRNVQSGMVWNQPITNICAVFSVLRKANNGANAILGCTKRFEEMGSARTNNDFGRGVNPSTDGGGIATWGNYILSTSAASCVKDGWIYADGKEKGPYDNLSEFDDSVVLEMHPLAPYGRADAFAIQEWKGVTYSGCQQQMECIIYTNELSQTERMKVCAYLLNKWKGMAMRGPAQRFSGDASLDEVDMSGGISVELDSGEAMGISSVTGGTVVKDGDGLLYVDLIDGAGIDVRGGEMRVRSVANDESVLPSGQFIHLDATKTDTMEFTSYTFRGETIDNMVETWRDPATNIYAHTRRTDSRCRPGYLTYPEALGGKPVVDYSSITNTNPNTLISDGCFHNFYVGNVSSTDSVKATTAIGGFFALIGSRNGGGVPLGTFNANPWRAASDNPAQPFYNSNAPKGLRLAEGLLNGQSVSLTDTGLSGGYDVVSVRNLYGTGGDGINSIMTAATRTYTGGGEIGELLIYETPLSYESYRRIDAYLGWKWHGRKTPGFSPATATSVSVSESATLSIDGGAPVTAMSVSGAGTVNGSLVCAEGCVVTAKVAESGGLEVLSVTGRLDVSRGGTVSVVGNARRIGPGSHAIIAAGSVSGGLGEWTITGVEGLSYTPKVGLRGGALCLVMPSGLTLIVR